MRLWIIFLAQLGLSLCGVLVQKLTWRESAKSKMIKTGNWVEYNNHQKNLRAISYAQKRNISQRFIDYVDVEYLATVTIGTPPQEFNVLLDTGAPLFWIPSISCNKFPCEEKQRFNPAESSTYAKLSGKWEIGTLTGHANGEYGEDTVRFGPKDNACLTIPQVKIGEAMEIGPSAHDRPRDGIFGLALGPINNDYPPVLMEAYEKKLMDKPIFTVYYEKRGYQSGVDGGQITFGGVDTDHCGEVAYIYLTRPDFWQFTVDRVQMGGSLHEGPFEVVSDTGSSVIWGPDDIMSSILQKISAEKLEALWVADCATTATFDITIGGKLYSIQPENYIYDYKVGDKCRLALESVDMSAYGHDFSFILGAPFLRQFCNIHDMERERIGFAPVLGRAKWPSNVAL